MNYSVISWQPMLAMLLIILYSAVFLAISALPIMVIFGQTLSIVRKRSAYEKCAKQLSLLTLWFSWFLTLSALWPVSQRIIPYIVTMSDTHAATSAAPSTTEGFDFSSIILLFQDNILIQTIVFLWCGIFLATVIITLCHIYWSVWKIWRLTYQSALIVAACWFGLVLYGVICVVHAEHVLPLGIEFPASLKALLVPPFESAVWNTVPYIPALAFAMAGGVAAVWLIIRRTKDDFGRDYYASMLPWCAIWARNGWFVLWLMFMGMTAIQWLTLLQESTYLQNPEFMRSALLLLLWLIPGVLWTLCTKSATPLRHKGTLILALVLGMGIIVPLYMGLLGY